MKRIVLSCNLLLFIFSGVISAQEGPWFVFNSEDGENTLVLNPSRADVSDGRMLFVIKIEQNIGYDDYIDVNIDWGETIGQAGDVLDIEFTFTDKVAPMSPDFVGDDVEIKCKGVVWGDGDTCRLSPKNSAYIISMLDEIELFTTLYSTYGDDEVNEEEKVFLFGMFETKGLAEALNEYENQNDLKQFRTLLAR